MARRGVLRGTGPPARGKLLPGKGYVLTMDRHDPGLQLEDDPAFHERMWRLRRVGRFGMLLFILLGVAGLLGTGPLSRAEVRDAQGLRIAHERFARAEAPQAMRIQIPAPAADSYRIALSRDFLDRVRIDSVVPEPVLAEALADRVVYAFTRRASTDPAVATFHFTPHAVGFVRAGLGVPGLAPLTIWMVVYP